MEVTEMVSKQFCLPAFSIFQFWLSWARKARQILIAHRQSRSFSAVFWYLAKSTADLNPLEIITAVFVIPENVNARV